MIQRRGLDACADIVAHVSSAQLAELFDADLWRSARPGLDASLDAERFGAWIAVLMDCGASIAAEKIAGLDADLVVAGLAQHLRVFDRAATARRGFEIGGYLVEPGRTDSWDAIADLLVHLHDERHDYFNRVMAGCRRLSNAGFERDGLDDLLADVEQQRFDLAIERDARRESQAFVSPSEARAFLQLARRQGGAVAQVRDRGRALGLVRAGDDEPSCRAQEELAFLANALIAGCAIQGRAFTPREASQAAGAICRLGAENAPGSAAGVMRAFETGWRILYQDVCLAAASRLLHVLEGLRVVDRDTQMEIDTLRRGLARCRDEGEPWRARDALDVIMTLDMIAWAGLRELIAECPVLHAAVDARGSTAISASAFEFISGNAQLAVVRDFLDALPALIGPAAAGGAEDYG
jgi:hypothetical protein